MFKRILVPIDGSETSSRGLDEALRLARLTGAAVKLIHVLDELASPWGIDGNADYQSQVVPYLKKQAEHIVEEGRARAAQAGIAVDTQLLDCYRLRTADVVLEDADAWKADLIVLGTHGRRGPRRLFLGSDAEQILRGAAVPVLLVRGPEPDARVSVRAAVRGAVGSDFRVATT
jgi:nucleotide-binding universal stress UspA family protein